MTYFEGEDKRKWHIPKEISIGDIVGLVSAIAAVLIAYGKLDTRVALLEQSQAAQIVSAEKAVIRMELSIYEIDRKLDRLIESRTREPRR